MALSRFACIPVQYQHMFVVGIICLVLVSHGSLAQNPHEGTAAYLVTNTAPPPLGQQDPEWHAAVSVPFTSQTTPKPKPVIHIGALFPMSRFNDYHRIFTKTLDRINSDPATTVIVANVSLATVRSVHHDLKYVCLAMREFNISSIIVVGNQDTINTLSIITSYSGIPVLGYNTDRTSITIRGERPLYLQLDPSKSIQARAIVHALQANQWYYASLITEASYANDGFVDTFQQLTSDIRWHFEVSIVLPRRSSTAAVDSALLNLLDNKSRVLILHCSAHLARKVFQVAHQHQLIEKGYVWFVSEDVVVKSPRILRDYPIGLVGVTLSKKFDTKSVVADATSLVAKATERFVNEHGADSFKKSCKEYQYAEDDTVGKGLLFYRYLKNTTYEGSNIISFDDDGVLKEATYRIVNLVEDTENRNKTRWRTIGYYNNGTSKLSTIVWPGGSTSGPIVVGERTLRVVTNPAEPFVMEQIAVDERCETAVPCLNVQTKDKDVLDDIFKDFSNGVHNASRPYQMHCCQGFSIKLLERLALDMNFTFQLYITMDRHYGNFENDSWNGLVQDLMVGAAHMAITAFSITRSRSRVIEFTDPYFFSGFSILVSERKRSPPIYAFMEPFDSWVWISIVVSATVVAVALSLLEWNSPFGLNPWGRKRKNNYTLGSGLNMVYAILFQHTIKTKSPKAWPSKWLQNYWAGASIFIYSSYTANLAAFLAGKNSGVTIDGIHDPQLLEPGRHVGVLEGVAVQDYLRQVNTQLLRKSTRYDSTLPLQDAVGFLMDGKIDAYLDDTPILAYARTTMDAKCQLRLIGKGFGEDAYGIGLPRNSWLQNPISEKIREYQENGVLDDLNDLYFRRSRCIDQLADGQLQGEASRMKFDQHAGLYMLLVVGIFTCIALMFLEHALFKWMVPYWRRKPPTSFWRSLSMLFWSQRLYRIITSEELVSPHHSAREMMEDFKNRDFTKLFQKSVRRQEKKNLFKSSNIFRVVEQLQLKARREERLSQNPSTQTEGSMDSEPGAGPGTEYSHQPRSLALTTLNSSTDGAGTSDTNDESCREEPQIACRPKKLSTKRSDLQIKKHKPSLREAHASSIFSEPVTSIEKSTRGTASEGTPDRAKSDDELLQSSDLDGDVPLTRVGSSLSAKTSYKLLNVSKADRTSGPSNQRCDISVDMEDSSEERDRRYSNPTLPLLGRTSSSEDNLTSGAFTIGGSGTELLLPNGMVIHAPNGDVFVRNASTGKHLHVRPKKFASFRNPSPNLPDSLKSLPAKGNRIKSSLSKRESSEGSLTQTDTNNELLQSNLDRLTKEDLFMMWQNSESELHQKLKQALKDKADLEKRLLSARPDNDT